MTFFKSLSSISLATLLTLMSCGPAEQKAAPTTEATTEQAKSDGGDLLVGAVFPMTGPIATYGQETINGAMLALKKINAQGRIHGRSIRLISEDNKGEPAESANAVRKLIDVNKVHLIFGSVASSNTLAGAPIAQSAKVPMVTPASTNEAVTQKGDYIFRTCFTDNFQGVVMAKFAREGLKKNKAVIIVDVASDYSRGLAQVFERNFTGMGGTVVKGEFTYNQGDKDFRSLLRKVKRANPDIVFLPGYYTEVGIMLQQARQMGITLPVLGGDGWDSPKLQELAGAEGIKNNYISSHFAAGDQDPTVQAFVEEYKKNFSVPPGAMAALGYDGMLVIADALKRAGPNPDHASIRSALAQTQNFAGITGAITIDENRNAKKGAVILKTVAEGMQFESKISP